MGNGLTAAVLSWKSPVTTRSTLESYRSGGLYDCCDEFFVYYNQYSAEDRALCDEFGIRSCGTSENSGIWNGQKGILAEAKNDYILFLQNDHPVVVSSEETKKWVLGGLEFLKSGKADIVSLRHRNLMGCGYGFGSKAFKFYYVRELNPAYAAESAGFPPDFNRDTFRRKLLRALCPGKVIRYSASALYLEKHPEKVFPKYIRREGDFLIADSAIYNYSESPFMISRDFYNRLCGWAEKHPSGRTAAGAQNLEIILNCSWWRKQHFRIATCDGGVFGHERKDDSWRPESAQFNHDLANGGVSR